MSEVLAPPADTFPRAISAAVQEAATAFFTTSCGLEHVPEADGSEEAQCAGIMSTISFMGDKPWAFAMALPEAAAVMIGKAFAGFEVEFDSPDMGDLMGEIANVIAGDISARLEAKGVKAQMSLPTSVRGENVALLVPHGVSTTRLLFAGPNGKCWFNLVSARTDGLAFRRPGAV